MSNENLKLKVAKEAVKLVEDGMVVGLGTGSTAALFIRELGNRIKEEELQFLVFQHLMKLKCWLCSMKSL